MPEYAYQAADARGARRDGVIEAASEDAALRTLRARGLTPLRVSARADAAAPGAGAIPAAGARAAAKGKPNQVDLLGFTSELAIMLRAGLSLDRALKVLIGMSHKASVGALLAGVLDAVKGGAPLSRAIAPHREFFGDFYINMVRSGEIGGQLSEVLTRLVEHLERIRALRESVISAMIYPAILLLVAVISVVAMLGFVVPQFESLFKDMGDALPTPTRIVVAVGHFFTDYGLFLAVGVFLAGGAATKWLASPAGRQWWQGWILRVPVFGRIFLKYEITRFTRSLGTLLGNGVPVISALNIATETVGNVHVRSAFSGVAPAMKGGGRMTEALHKTGLFEPMAINLVRVGEETGRLDSMMLELARILDREVETSIKRGLTLLEPLLILTLGVMIAGIIVSILMGILSVNDLAV
ncbi:type II secretion system F family protein [Zoogloea sp.]|uniref:type II secretion system F family protein n=1 Tax=Zoogloea sp. TaxID=49181 RepID=UPI001416C4C0|nr:MAG: type II secretion system F family protein [Zoogloea sp.]